jgi:hypothetical protein
MGAKTHLSYLNSETAIETQPSSWLSHKDGKQEWQTKPPAEKAGRQMDHD